MQGFIIWKFLLIGIFTTNLFGQSRNIQHPSYDQGPHTEIYKDGRYQKIHFVSGNGSDQIGNGSKENPWQSISFALLMIKDGSESNRIIRSADHWAVVKSNDEQMIEVWGDLVGHISFDILPTYQIK